jgi:hypothetical protein
LYEDSQIPQATIQAYLETEYRVYGSSPVALKIGEVSSELVEIHLVYGVDCSAFVTACNPLGQALDEAVNTARQATLAEELTRRRIPFVDGVGQHPSNGWTGEPSFLVLGVSLEDARALGLLCRQNAIVWSGSDSVPQLVLLR